MVQAHFLGFLSQLIEILLSPLLMLLVNLLPKPQQILPRLLTVLGINLLPKPQQILLGLLTVLRINFLTPAPELLPYSLPMPPINLPTPALELLQHLLPVLVDLSQPPAKAQDWAVIGDGHLGVLVDGGRAWSAMGRSRSRSGGCVPAMPLTPMRRGTVARPAHPPETAVAARLPALPRLPLTTAPCTRRWCINWQRHWKGTEIGTT